MVIGPSFIDEARKHCERVPKQQPCCSLHLLQDLAQEILKAQRNVSITVIVILLEHIRHPLQTDASLHKQVKAHNALASYRTS